MDENFQTLSLLLNHYKTHFQNVFPFKRWDSHCNPQLQTLQNNKYSIFNLFSDSTDHIPTQNLLIQGRTFEEQATSFIKDVFEPSGFVVEKFTRLPYLCEGDLHKSFYVLNDAVFVLKLKDTG